MFDFAFSEIALVGVVALLVIGPKDMPVAIKTVTDLIKKARRMAHEFQGHVDEMVRDANLHDVRDSLNELRSIDVKGRLLSAVDSDGTLRRSLDEDSFRSGSREYTADYAPAAETIEAARPALAAGDAPAFVPPAYVPHPPPEPPAAPAFVPPGAARATRN